MVFWVFISGVSYGQVTISTNTIWDNPTLLPSGYENGVIIQSGVQLSIENNVLNFNSGAEINVQSGAHLILVNTKLLAQNATSTWEGIKANGVGGEQFISFPKVPKKAGDPSDWSGLLNPDQTLVSLTDSDIENASIGVNSLNGAIVRVEASIFQDCEIGATINSYKSAQDPDKNACHFMETTFKWTQNIFTASNKKGINLINVNGVRIGGCKFVNEDPQKYCEADRGVGIYSDRSDFSASSAGNKFCFDGDDGCVKNCYGTTKGSGNEFENLSLGVEVVGAYHF